MAVSPVAERGKAKMAETTLSSTFSILLKYYSGKTIFVPVSLDETVLDLKMKLFALDSHFRPSALMLKRDGWELMIKRRLKDYNITTNSIIHQTSRMQGGDSAASKGKEDVSATDARKPDMELEVLPAELFSMLEMKGGEAGASSWMESQGTEAGITSTSVKEIQKWPQSDVPAEERSCRCVRQELQEVRPEIDRSILKEQNIYKACLPGPGIFQCSETGLAFEVESAASIVYRYASWKMHLKKADQKAWVPAGPLFNIWALPGTVRAVYLPHFICLSDVDISGCSIAHFEFQKMTIQQPTKVMPFYAVLENPSFSLLGVVWRKLRSAISLPVHSLVLIFQQLSAADTTLHLYLIPDDISVKQAIEGLEMHWNSKLIPKPPPFSPLFFGYRYQVSSNTQVEITPEPHLPFYYKSPEEQQLFVEIYIKNMAEEVEFLITDKQNDTVVWRASLRSGDISLSRKAFETPSGAAFLKKHKTELCSRMGQLSSVLLHLRDEDVINSEEEEEVQAQNTNQKKNKFLLDLAEKKGPEAQEKLFQVLQKKNPYLVGHLENTPFVKAHDLCCQCLLKRGSGY